MEKYKLNDMNFGDDTLMDVVKQIVISIKAGEYIEAHALLKEGAKIDMESPIIYNLLGILYEVEGDYLKAVKFYRVAYYMDPTFKAASENLDRVGVVFRKGRGEVSWGVNFEGGEN